MISIKLLCLNFSMGVLLEICSIFSEHLFLKARRKGCFCNYIITNGLNYVKEYTNKKWKNTRLLAHFCKHERLIYLKVTNHLNGARKLQQMRKCKIVVIFIKEVDIYNLKLSKLLLQKQPLRGVFEKRCSENMQQIYRRTPIPKCNFNKVAKQLYCNRTSAWVFFCKFAAYFPNTFS